MFAVKSIFMNHIGCELCQIEKSIPSDSTVCRRRAPKLTAHTNVLGFTCVLLRHWIYVSCRCVLKLTVHAHARYRINFVCVRCLLPIYVCVLFTAYVRRFTYFVCILTYLFSRFLLEYYTYSLIKHS